MSMPGTAQQHQGSSRQNCSLIRQLVARIERYMLNISSQIFQVLLYDCSPGLLALLFCFPYWSSLLVPAAVVCLIVILHVTHQLSGLVKLYTPGEPTAPVDGTA